MEGLALLGVALLFTVIIGSILGILAFTEVRSLRVQVRDLSARLQAGQVVGVEKTAQLPPEAVTRTAPPPAAAAGDAEDLWLGEDLARVADALDDAASSAGVASDTRHQSHRPSLIDRIQENWMVWLGGACVALAGVFLARYGIEQGLLGPKVRVAAGLITALALYVAAEWMRIKTGSSSPVFAALAGGGAITAFAAVLSAVHLYHLFSPGFAFGLLAVVAVVTMWLARLHGPVLAAIGMLGAYCVPLLVSSGSGNLLGALIYSLIITMSVLLLLRYVYRPWLWLGVLAGALGWWLLSLTSGQVDGWRGPYLAALAYLVFAVVPGDWALRGTGAGSPAAMAAEKFLLPGVLPIVAAQCISMLHEGFHSGSLSTWSYLAPVLSGHALLNWGPLAVVLLLAARYRASLALLPWVLYVGQLVVWALMRLERTPGTEQWRLIPWPADLQGAFLTYLAVTALLFAGMALWNLRRGVARYWWASLAVMAPLLALVTGYLLAADYLPLYLWCLLAAIFGAVFLFLGSLGAGKHWPKAAVVWLFVAGHFGYTLAVGLWLQQASLTLALAVQAISLAWVIRRFDVPGLGLLLKGLLVVVVVRLTLNPWLLTYAADTHWSLWTYGGSAACAWIATRLLRDFAPPLARWTEATAWHLLVLALWAECRYWLYGGNAFAAEFSFAEAVVNVWLFACLGLVYYRKSLVSNSFAVWYDGYSRILMLAAATNYGFILFAVAESNPWAWAHIGSRPLLNLLLPAFAGPALLALLASRLYLPALRRVAAVVAAVAGFIWVSLEVRHLWQGNIRLDVGAGTGELYTYSAVWLTLAVTAILLGSWRGWRACYQAGMGVLALVIVKLFLVDMSGLEGLLRVASFMGLGLALLGIAYLHQRLSADKTDSSGPDFHQSRESSR